MRRRVLGLAAGAAPPPPPEPAAASAAHARVATTSIDLRQLLRTTTIRR